MNADDYDVSPKGPYYFSQIRVDPNNDQNIFVTQDGFRHSTDGGKTWDAPRVFPRMFGDVRTLWIDPENPDRMIQGSDGGIAISYDGGRHERSLRQHAGRRGLRDQRRHGRAVQPLRGAAGSRELARAVEHGHGTRHARRLARGRRRRRHVDGRRSDRQPMALHHARVRSHSRARSEARLRDEHHAAARAGQPPYRFIWETPIVLSRRTTARSIYAGAQVLLRSTDRGDHWTEISPDLSTNPADKILPESEGGVPGGIPWFAISSISESPLTPGVIWAGTSDGKVHVTRNDGGAWTDVTPKIAAAGGREDAYVSRVRRVGARRRPRVRRRRAATSSTTSSRTSIAPRTSARRGRRSRRTCRTSRSTSSIEDRKNPESALRRQRHRRVRLDRSRRALGEDEQQHAERARCTTCSCIRASMTSSSAPTDAIFWITNIAPLQELTAAVLDEDVHLFSIEPTVQRMTWPFGANDYLFGQRHLQTPNEPNGMLIRYYLKTAAAPRRDRQSPPAGTEVAQLAGQPATPGINTSWSGTCGRRRGAGGAAVARPRSAPPLINGRRSATTP